MSYQAVKQITSQLESLFEKFDKMVEIGVIEYTKRCFVNLQAAREQYKSISRDSWSYYPKLFEAAGGKSNYLLIQYGVGIDVEQIIYKSEKAKIDKRNLRIADKLEKAGITEVKSTQIIHSTNGFNGLFEVETDKGYKKIVIETIFACGEFNCPHFRVLVKVK